LNVISSFLDALEIGEPVISGSVVMFPLLAADFPTGSPLTFEKAMQFNLLHVEETSLSGSVPELVIDNRGAEPVFLLDGEQVLGLNQNRTFNLSMLVEPNSRVAVPVSCLEAGRWSRAFEAPRAAEHVHFATGRANKLRTVSESIRRSGSYASDQSAVWQDISSKFETAREQSMTSAEADYYASRRSEVESMSSPLRAQPNQVGAVIGTGSRLLGVDVFLTPKLYASLHDKLLKSYLLDVVDASDAFPSSPPEFVSQKLQALFGSEPVRAPAPGAGEALRWSSSAGHAAALIADGECIHAVGFFSSGGQARPEREVA
jgi:hypothetical protein